MEGVEFVGPLSPRLRQEREAILLSHLVPWGQQLRALLSPQRPGVLFSPLVPMPVCVVYVISPTWGEGNKHLTLSLVIHPSPLYFFHIISLFPF